MKGTRHLAGSGVLGLFLLFSMPATALPPFSEYGPACQWIRLIGEIQRPPGLEASEPVLLTVTYRLPEQRAPATLLTNQPVTGERFVFVLSGFDEKISGIHFVDPGFFFAKRIEFRYFARTVDGKWKSRWQQSVYLPDLDKQDGKTYCRSGIGLQPLALEAR